MNSGVLEGKREYWNNGVLKEGRNFAWKDGVLEEWNVGRKEGDRCQKSEVGGQRSEGRRKSNVEIFHADQPGACLAVGRAGKSRR